MRLLMLLVDDLRPDAEEVERIKRGVEALSVAPVDVTVEPIGLGMGHYYEDAVGLAMAAPGVLHQVLRHQTDVDAIMLGCFGDPGLHAARAVSSVPVIGAGEASMILAQLYGEAFGVIHIRESNIAECRNQAKTLRLEHKCVGMGSIDLAFDEVLDDEAVTLRRLEREAGALVDQGADVIVLGCMSLGLGPFSERLSASLGIPVVNPVRAALAAVGVHAQLGTPPRGRPEQYAELRGYLSALHQVADGEGLSGYRLSDTRHQLQADHAASDRAPEGALT
jgi:allantoin racemase